MAEVTCHPNPQGMDTEGSLELSSAGLTPSRFNERSCLKETIWRTEYQYPSLVPTCVHLNTYVHICPSPHTPKFYYILCITCVVRITLIALPYKLQHSSSFVGNLCLQFLTSLSLYMRTFSRQKWKEPGTASVGSLLQPGLGCYHIPSARTQSRGLCVLRTERKWNMMDSPDKKNELLESWVQPEPGG